MTARPLAFGLAAVALVASAPGDLAVGAFSVMTPGMCHPADWAALRVGDTPATMYTLVRDGGQTVVRAEADGSASGLIRRLDVDPAQRPVLAWRWKVENVHPSGDITREHGDDYAARISVTFAYDPDQLSFGERMRYRALRLIGRRDVPVRALHYVWANQPDETAAVASAYTSRVRMVPVESGPAHVGRWRDARRDVAADYRAAFGEPPPPINGIALMTDGDNTGGAAVAYYGDIVMRAR